jgi:hypothetical protein
MLDDRQPPVIEAPKVSGSALSRAGRSEVTLPLTGDAPVPATGSRFRRSFAPPRPKLTSPVTARISWFRPTAGCKNTQDDPRQESASRDDS